MARHAVRSVFLLAEDLSRSSLEEEEMMEDALSLSLSESLRR